MKSLAKLKTEIKVGYDLDTQTTEFNFCHHPNKKAVYVFVKKRSGDEMVRGFRCEDCHCITGEV